jgi:hypothetical protein
MLGVPSVVPWLGPTFCCIGFATQVFFSSVFFDACFLRSRDVFPLVVNTLWRCDTLLHLSK